MRLIICNFILLFSLDAFSQGNAYRDSLVKFQKAYVVSHEVVKKADRKYVSFYPVKEKYRVVAKLERIMDTAGIIMKTSGNLSKKYFRYGLLSFSIAGQPLQLTIYQSEQLMKDPEYKDYLFVPFTDLTSGEQSYGGGRYMDFLLGDIRNNSLLIDFNKAYNPYCAYTTGYNCPVPPRENDLPIAIQAGEKAFGKAH